MSDSSIIVLYLVLWCIGSVAGIAWVVMLQRRAAAGDHVAEADPDPQIPDHCVICGAAHPTESIPIYPTSTLPRTVPGQNRRAGVPFLFCRSCAAPIRRTRRLGRILVASALILLACVPLAFLFMAGHYDLMKRLPFDSWRITIGLVIVFFCACEAALFGRLAANASPGIMIVPEDEGNALFKFRNQVYRNHFAKMNGAE